MWKRPNTYFYDRVLSYIVVYDRKTYDCNTIYTKNVKHAHVINIAKKSAILSRLISPIIVRLYRDFIAKNDDFWRFFYTENRGEIA
jgi:hypothetical protein